MNLRQWIAPALLAAAAYAEVKIEPPSPYMSSPPPAEADTTVVDPGRKPDCETQPGLVEAWYADWNLKSDRPSAGPLETKSPRRGMPTFRAAFDDNGWPTELVYFDAGGRPRWTKLFRYPARIPSGPGTIGYQVNWIGSNGKAIVMSKVVDAFKATKWEVGMKKYEIGDALGEPLMIEITSPGTMFSAKAETWVYWIDDEVRFSFDKDNRLVALPRVGTAQAAKPVAAAMVKPEPAPVQKLVVDSVQHKAPEAKAPAPKSKGSKAK